MPLSVLPLTPVRFILYADGHHRFAQKLRRLFRRSGIDVKAGAPFEPGDLGQLGHDLHVPVIGVLGGFPNR